jgi:hypothetical protein
MYLSVVLAHLFVALAPVFVCIPFRDETLDAEHEHDSQCGSEDEEDEDDAPAGRVAQGALD